MKEVAPFALGVAILAGATAAYHQRHEYLMAPAGAWVVRINRYTQHACLVPVSAHVDKLSSTLALPLCRDE